METPITFPVLSLFPHHWHFSWLPLNGNSPKLSQFLVFFPPSLILLLAITKSNGNSQELSLDIIRSPALSSKPSRIFSQVLIFFFINISRVSLNGNPKNFLYLLLDPRDFSQKPCGWYIRFLQFFSSHRWNHSWLSLNGNPQEVSLHSILSPKLSSNSLGSSVKFFQVFFSSHH